jgi:hypothetical protein
MYTRNIPGIIACNHGNLKLMCPPPSTTKLMQQHSVAAQRSTSLPPRIHPQSDCPRTRHGHYLEDFQVTAKAVRGTEHNRFAPFKKFLFLSRLKNWPARPAGSLADRKGSLTRHIQTEGWTWFDGKMRALNNTLLFSCLRYDRKEGLQPFCSRSCYRFLLFVPAGL